MKVLLAQLDGKLPNIALMRLAAHYRKLGHDITFRRCFSAASTQPHIGDDFDNVLASTIFDRTQPVTAAFRKQWPQAVIGGTGSGSTESLEDVGVGLEQDYSIYPDYPHSIGYTQRGCRLKCGFCMVPQMEGAVRPEQGIYDIWRGDPHPRNLSLLDNDFFGQPNWRDHIRDIRNGNFKVSFNQGVNIRMVGDDEAHALSSVRYYDDDFKVRRLYTAWDNARDEERLFRGLNLLKKYGVKPDHIMVYMLIGYWIDETHQHREYRRRKLREFGCRPYPMPFVRTPELIGYQRWVVRRADLMCSWEDYVAAGYDSRGFADAA